jgi:hypothetical protein
VPGLGWRSHRAATPGGRPRRGARSNFRRRVWLPALTKTGLPEIHFHDLRHTGNILTATAGASLRELMARMGHASTRAALVYLHDTDDRQRAIATVISDLARPELGQPNMPSEGASENAAGTWRGTTSLQVIFVRESSQVELGGLEPPTPCLQTEGNTSTAVCMCRSASQGVCTSPPGSWPVAVLSCCTHRRVRSSPGTLRYARGDR